MKDFLEKCYFWICLFCVYFVFIFMPLVFVILINPHTSHMSSLAGSQIAQPSGPHPQALQITSMANRWPSGGFYPGAVGIFLNPNQRDPIIWTEYYFQAFGLMSRVFTNGPEDRGSIPGQVIPKTQKMVLYFTLLNTQYYKVKIKGKVEQSRNGVVSSPIPQCSSYWNGSLWVTFD